MRKFGKYEIRPEASVEKKPEIKSTLLRTYFTSLLCMVLCVAMFLGTSYAWFTSEVTSSSNEIYIGTLDVGLFKDSTTGALDLADSNNKLFDGNIRWEPGHTVLETIRVVNEGDLAFNYALTFTDGKINDTVDNTLLVKAAEHFVVYVHAGNYADGEAAPADFGAIETSDKWKPVMLGDQVATLADILTKGVSVLSGSISDVRGAQNATAPLPGPNDSKPTADTYIIALHMNNSASEAGIMGQKIGLSVKLTAYQQGYEPDSFNNKYDQMVATPGELKAAFLNGGSVALAADITAENVQTLAEIPENVQVDLYLNGHSINAKLADPDTGATQLFSVKKGAKLTIHGDDSSTVHVAAGKSLSKTSATINNCGGTVVINGGNFSMTYGSYGDGYLLPTIIDNNSTLGASTVIINGGKFTHTRNMFRNFANHNTEAASLIINGGSFIGASDDFGSFWNQKTNATRPLGAGIVELNGGTFQYMGVCTGFADSNNNPAGVTASNNVALDAWVVDGDEWTAHIHNISNP